MSKKVKLEPTPQRGDDRAFRLTLLLRDGRELTATGNGSDASRGFPTILLKEKFLKLTGLSPTDSQALYDRLIHVERESVSELFADLAARSPD
jgi:hypothetical protein